MCAFSRKVLGDAGGRRMEGCTAAGAAVGRSADRSRDGGTCSAFTVGGKSSELSRVELTGLNAAG